jgi:asparaginyl-tRNA synthetase
MLIKHLLQSESARDSVEVSGWVRTKRSGKAFSFIEINDGSCLKNLQLVVQSTLPNYSEIEAVSTGASIRVKGALVASQGQGQSWEIQASEQPLRQRLPGPQ